MVRKNGGDNTRILRKIEYDAEKEIVRAERLYFKGLYLIEKGNAQCTHNPPFGVTRKILPMVV